MTNSPDWSARFEGISGRSVFDGDDVARFVLWNTAQNQDITEWIKADRSIIEPIRR